MRGPLSASDIVYYLDDQVCREVAPRFPGWEKAEAAWANARASGETAASLKRWVAKEFKLKLERDRVRSLAHRTREMDKVPIELERVVKELVTLAAGRRR
jgi:hypothetical protein